MDKFPTGGYSRGENRVSNGYTYRLKIPASEGLVGREVAIDTGGVVTGYRNFRYRELRINVEHDDADVAVNSSGEVFEVGLKDVEKVQTRSVEVCHGAFRRCILERRDGNKIYQDINLKP